MNLELFRFRSLNLNLTFSRTKFWLFRVERIFMQFKYLYLITK